MAVVAFSPRLTDIINADQTSFLPDSYESVQAQQLAAQAFPQASGSTVIGVVGQVQPPQLSPDRRVGQVDLLLTMNPSSAEALDLVGPLRGAAHAAAPPGTTVLVGGTSSATADLRQATGRDLLVILPVAGVLIALVLALLLRSLVAPST